MTSGSIPIEEYNILRMRGKEESSNCVVAKEEVSDFKCFLDKQKHNDFLQEEVQKKRQILKEAATKILMKYSPLKMRTLVRILRERGFETNSWQMSYLMRNDEIFILEGKNWRLRNDHR